MLYRIAVAAVALALIAPLAVSAQDAKQAPAKKVTAAGPKAGPGQKV